MSSLSPRQMFLLDEACKPIATAFGCRPYLVGTAAIVEKTAYRDIDVRLILPDEEFDTHKREVLIFLGFAIGEYLAARTGLPIDFQIQRQTEANEKHNGVRNALGCRNILEFQGDAHPEVKE